MPTLRTHDTQPAARVLEISTSEPPPAVKIIAPTPGVFTFPSAHNLADSPYASPSNSPFEPDLCRLALSAPSTPHQLFPHDLERLDDRFNHGVQEEANREQATLPQSAFMGSLSSRAPNSTSTSSASPAFSPAQIFIPSPAPSVRRKSSSAAPDVRRPKRGDDDYVKRPENAFILFRRWCCKERALSLSSPSTSALSSPSPPHPSVAAAAASPVQAGKKKERQADLSKVISARWKALSPGERAHWEALAGERKLEHEALHPGYVYRPQRAAKRSAPSVSSSGAGSSKCGGQQVDSAPQVKFVVPAPRAQRSASAPAYHAVQIPNVYLGARSSSSSQAPSSASTSSSHGFADASSEAMISSGGFDYIPSVKIARAQASAFDFEAGLQARDFLRARHPPASLSSVSPLPSSGGLFGGISSPASSTSGSPHTPVSLPPSAFASTYTSGADGAASFSSFDAFVPGGFAPQDILGLSPHSSLGLADGLHLQGGAGQEEDDHTSYASAWAPSSPWSSTNFSSSLDASGMGIDPGDFDFDIGRIPELGWELGSGCTLPSLEGHGLYPDLELGARELEVGAKGDFSVGAHADFGGEMAMDFGVG
ncbi:hypothetical protein FB451DRAFT_1378350 [Mycena latifolia]|nr:hypothetical protein FB451DRAFT_1378350 [Mycena latifolia]